MFCGESFAGFCSILLRYLWLCIFHQVMETLGLAGDRHITRSPSVWRTEATRISAGDENSLFAVLCREGSACFLCSVRFTFCLSAADTARSGQSVVVSRLPLAPRALYSLARPRSRASDVRTGDASADSRRNQLLKPFYRPGCRDDLAQQSSCRCDSRRLMLRHRQASDVTWMRAASETTTH